MNQQRFDKYVKVQKSGKVNMIDVTTVSRLTGLSRDECLDIIKNYDKYSNGDFGGK